MQRMIENKSNHFRQRLFASVALAISVMLVCSTTSASEPGSSQSTAQAPSQSSEQTTNKEKEPKEGQWRRVSPRDALATFLAPKKPRYVERSFTPVANMPPITVHLYLSTINEGKETYIFGYHDLHELSRHKTAIDRTLDGAVRGSVINVDGKLIGAVSPICFKKHSGRQFKYQYEQNEKTYTVLSRVFLVKKRQYQISAVALQSEYNETKATEYLNSFKLVVIINDEPPVPRTNR